MGILDRFKSTKEQTLKQGASPVVKAAEKQEEKKPAAKAEKTKATEPKKEAKPKAAQAVSGAFNGVIISPLVTEKSAGMAQAGQYVFEIAPSANRIQVRSAIKAMYGITPARVNIQNYRGKRVRFGRRLGTRKAWKKAIVTLPKGKTIDVYEGV